MNNFTKPTLLRAVCIHSEIVMTPTPHKRDSPVNFYMVVDERFTFDDSRITKFFMSCIGSSTLTNIQIVEDLDEPITITTVNGELQTTLQYFLDNYQA